MKKGDECRCERCGELYTYHGGRPNPYCPDCFAVVRRERATAQMLGDDGAPDNTLRIEIAGVDASEAEGMGW